MTVDPTETVRRAMQETVNAQKASRARLEAAHGKVWDSDELQKDFVVLGFLAPFVSVERKADGVRGSLFFQHSPRFYFSFEKAQSLAG